MHNCMGACRSLLHSQPTAAVKHPASCRLQTVEVLALVLANPAPVYEEGEEEAEQDENGLILSR